MTEIRLMREEDFSAVHQVYKAAFASFPWYEDLSDAEVTLRLASQFKKPGFTGLVLLDDGIIVGAHWFDTISLEILKRERGGDLASWTLCNGGSGRLLIWERELIVHPAYQKRGYAHLLRAYFLDILRSFDESLIVLKRLREDNVGSIRSAEKIGMFDTGVTKAASQKPLLHHYWALAMTRS